jgi:hypothetical protein
MYVYRYAYVSGILEFIYHINHEKWINTGNTTIVTSYIKTYVHEAQITINLFIVKLQI